VKLRKIIFWCHLPAGVVAGIVILIMSVTGVLLTYERQITAWFDTRSIRIEAAAGSTRLSLEALPRRVRESRPDLKPATLTYDADPTQPAAIGLGREGVLLVDPYTGSIAGEGSKNVREFFRSVTDLHRWLGAQGENRALGRAITGACNFAFLFLVVSGLYLWWPRSLRSIRNVLWFRRGLAGKTRDFNWHNVFGFWALAPLFVIVLGSVVISYTWASNLVYRIAGEAPPAPRPAAAQTPAVGPNQPQRLDEIRLDGLDSLWARAETQVEGWRTISLRIPAPSEAAATFTIDRGDGGQPQKRAQLLLDRNTGEVARWEPFSSNSPGRKARSILRFAHTGEVAGIAGQTIAGIASFSGAMLVWTGLSLALRRFRGWLAKRSRAASPALDPSIADSGVLDPLRGDGIARKSPEPVRGD
jgi:uncharacterized iron-regulated membrane protein